MYIIDVESTNYCAAAICEIKGHQPNTCIL